MPRARKRKFLMISPPDTGRGGLVMLELRLICLNYFIIADFTYFDIFYFELSAVRRKSHMTALYRVRVDKLANQIVVNKQKVLTINCTAGYPHFAARSIFVERGCGIKV